MSAATLQLNLVSGSTQQRLRALALDSANVRQSWDALPANLQRAHRELLNLGTQQTRLGYLRHEERQSFRLHAEYVRRHQDAVQAHMMRLKATIDSSPHLQRYEAARADGTLATAIASDPHMEQLHRAHRQVDEMQRQAVVMSDSQEMFDRWGMHGDFRTREAAAYWGRRGMLGTRDGETPRTVREWGTDAAKDVYGRATGMVRQVAGVLGAFSIASYLNSSVREFDQRSQDVQRIGARLGGAFDDAGKAIDRLRTRTSFSRREIVPAIEAISRVLGTAGIKEGGLADQALVFGRATGLGTGAASQFAQMAMFGGASPQLAWGMMHAARMSDRPEAFLAMLSAAQSAMGQGQVAVRDGAAAQWAGYASDIGGEAFRSDRGAALISRLIAGSKAMPNPFVEALKSNAVVNTGRYNLGGGVQADTGTMWGLQMASQSGLPGVFERQLAAVVETHGGPGSELARHAVMNAFPGMTPIDVELAIRGRRRGVRFRDPRREAANAPPMDEAATAATTPTDRLNAQMEATYEAAGKELLPTVRDVKRMLDEIGQGIAGNKSAIQAFQDAMHHLIRDAEGGTLTRSVASIIAASMADTGLGKALNLGVLWGAGGGAGPDKDEAVNAGRTWFLKQMGVAP